MTSVSELSLLVVGGTSGVGRSVGLLAAKGGAAVVVAGRRSEQLAEVSELAGASCAGVECDVRDPESCARVVDDAVGRLGSLNAVLYTPAHVPLVWLEEASPEDWRAVLETNLLGAAQVVTRALAPLRETQGRVVFVSSDWLRYPRSALSLYGVSKAALDTLCVGFRIEVPEVSFSTVVLGPTAPTDIARDWDFEKATPLMEQWDERGIKYRGLMDVDDVAAEILKVITSPVRIDEVVLEPFEGGPQ